MGDVLLSKLLSGEVRVAADKTNAEPGMNKLKPWAAGPFELIRHAEGHLKAGSDFDKRMALISYDNAIEVSITTFLQLHPSQRGGKSYERKKTEEWLSNYHKKLEYLELLAKEKGVTLAVSIDEIIYYH